jgi:hypothetical protein
VLVPHMGPRVPVAILKLRPVPYLSGGPLREWNGLHQFTNAARVRIKEGR